MNCSPVGLIVALIRSESRYSTSVLLSLQLIPHRQPDATMRSLQNPSVQQGLDQPVRFDTCGKIAGVVGHQMLIVGDSISRDMHESWSVLSSSLLSN